MRSCRIEIKGIRPVPVNALYVPYRSRLILSKKGREFKEKIIPIIREQYQGDIMKGRLMVLLQIKLKSKRDWDIDGRIKALLDVMTRIVYEDDKQIYQLHVYKTFDHFEDEILISVDEMSTNFKNDKYYDSEEE